MAFRLRQLDLNWLIVAALCLFAIAPFLAPGYFWGAHDARSHVYFLFEYDRAIQDGILWPRWAPDFTFGYGYPFFNVYGPLATATAEVFYLLGIGYMGAIKSVFILSILGSGLAMYGFVRSWAGRTAGLVAAVAYVYVPYHLLDLYVRAALAESVAFVFMPLVLWSLRAAITRPRWSVVAALAVAYGGLMFTSQLVTLIFTLFVIVPYVAILTLAKINEVQPLRDLSSESGLPMLGSLIHHLTPAALGALLGLGLSAVFWLPALSEFQFVRQDQWYAGRYDYSDDFVYPFQLFSPRWGFGTSQAGPDDPLGFGLGIAPLLLALMGLGLAWGRRHQVSPEVRRHLRFFWLVLAVGVFMTLSVSAPLWGVQLIRSAQFPWRYLILTSVALAALSAGVVAQRRQKTVAGLLLVTILILGSFPYLRVEIQPSQEGPVSYAGLMRYQQGADEMTGSTAWVQEIPRWSPMADVYVKGGDVTSKVDYSRQEDKSLIVGSVGLSTIHEEVYFLARGPGKLITFNTFYYPGWRAYLLDGEHGVVSRELPIEPQGKLGRISVEVPQGEGYLLVRFEDTPVRVAGRWLSIVSLGLLAIGSVIRRVSRRW